MICPYCNTPFPFGKMERYQKGLDKQEKKKAEKKRKEDQEYWSNRVQNLKEVDEWNTDLDELQQTANPKESWKTFLTVLGIIALFIMVMVVTESCQGD